MHVVCSCFFRLKSGGQFYGVGMGRMPSFSFSYPDPAYGCHATASSNAIISFDAMWCSIRLSLQMADTLVSSLEREIQASWLVNA